MRTPLRCDGQRITDIVITTEDPFVGDISRRWRWLGRTLQDLHVTTKDDIVQRFLLFKVGETCTELRRAESERVLRGQPFLTDATVTTYDDGAGGVWVDVVTTDGLSLIIAAGTKVPRPSKFRIGDGNFMGEALSASVQWREGYFYRDSYSARVTDYQFLGRRYQLTAGVARDRLGDSWNGEVRQPFFTDLQRVAWQVNAGASDEYVTFRRTGDHPSLRVERDFMDLGGIVRIGVPGRLSLFGVSLSQERGIPDSLGVIISDTGVVQDTSGVLNLRYRSHRTARINLLWGVRNVQFKRMVGIDALAAPQDMRIGFQLGTLFGRGLSVIGAQDDDIFVSMDMYMGAATEHSFFGLQIQGEGRENYDERRWDGVLASGRAAWYIKPSVRNTIELSGEWGGGWRQRVPFQLSLGDVTGGVRGYRRSAIGGGQRGVVRLEERVSVRRVRNFAQVGLAAFVDAGEMLAGDAPFGVDTKVKYGAGLGLLAAVPPRSRRLWRVDVAFPLSPTDGKRWELRVTNIDRSRVFWREPADLRRSRSRSTPTSVFNWP